jgi:WXG100 family type VII secretion target
MAKAHVDPADLRRFAQDLTRFNNDLQTLLGGLHAKLRALEGTWRDQEQRKFTEAFEQTLKAMGNFMEASHEHVTLLGKKAALIEDYLKQR